MKFPRRVTEVPPYIFAELDTLLEAKKKAGIDIINIAQGDPDLPTPRPIVERMVKEIQNPVNHRYPSYTGAPLLREKIAEFMLKRFGVKLDPDRELMVLIGAKEGIAHLAWAVVPPEGWVLYPDPGYPTYAVLGAFADAQSLPIVLDPARGYKAGAEDLFDPGPAQMVILNYPHNPSGACMTLSELAPLIREIRRRDAVLLYDNAYSEIYFGSERPPSALACDGALENTVEVHSFSKTFNMTGWRLGWVAGNPDILKALYTIKTNVDSGVFNAIQYAGVTALELYDELVPPIREEYAYRKNLALSILKSVNIEPAASEGTFYLWMRLPAPFARSMEFVLKLLDEEGVLVSPGAGYGPSGEGWFRISLTAPRTRLEQGLLRLTDFVRRHQNR
jgi:LL-diaminopimelate aminotransferase